MRESQQKQLEKWVAGESKHNAETDECCPDFSCCRPELLWPEDQRKLFRDRPEIRDEMLMMSLSAAFGESAYVAGYIPEE